MNMFPSKPTKKIQTLLSLADRILDVGCGNSWLREYVEGSYVGVTNNPSEIQDETLLVDLEKESLDCFPSNSFDVVYAGHILEHLVKHDVKKLMQHMHRVTRKGGYCILVAPTDHGFFYGEWQHQRPYDHGSLPELLKDFNFKDVDWTYTRLEGMPKLLQRHLRHLPFLRLLFWSEITAWGVK